MRLISVETGLNEVKAHLKNCGYEVVDMGQCFRPVEATVYTGERSGATYSARSAENTVLVNAAGLTPEQVATELADKI
ncbi:YkuS family protein [Acetonema longum]|uniref:YkuS family protein n=1 Tax=Acetonema longum DSM 6540 TaxID=1009370 RepID=F7NIF8_9FIRM|nr:YkuS family protein [Acetonema longum]EGO64188.1 hypothetical protein ALO_09304 [Acetonema longum DSM 6540]